MYQVMQKKIIIYSIAILFSVVLSFWAAVREPLINNDGICYLQSAAMMPLGLHAVMDLCGQAKWPFYSIIIFYVASLAQLSYLHSAFFLNSLFSVLSLVAFLAIIQFLYSQQSNVQQNTKRLQDTARLLYLGAGVILFAHTFNLTKILIIRDHGFWAFYLLSILFLLHYFQSSMWRYAFAWSVSLTIASLFRVEGMIFLLVLPFIAFLNNKQDRVVRLQSFLKLNTILLLLVSVGMIGLLWRSNDTLTLGRVDEIIFQLCHGFMMLKQNVLMKAYMLEQTVLNHFSQKDAILIFILVLLAWYAVLAIKNISFIYSALVVYGCYKKLFNFDRMSQLVLWAYIVINILITLIFLTEFLFLSERYLVAFSLVVMLGVPFALNHLFKQWHQNRWLLMIAFCLILISGVGGIFNFGHSKKYVHDAGLWLAKNTPQNTKIYSNHYQVMYYSNHFGNEIFTKWNEFDCQNILQNNRWKQYDYLALSYKRRHDLSKKIEYEKQIGLPIQVFKNTRGDEVSIYQVQRSIS